MVDESFVSVVIPAYNQAKYLIEAIESVLAQSHKDYEIIVVDDGSTDGTPNVVKHFTDDIRYIQQGNQGLAGARNTGILAAKGELIGLLDADDLWLPNYLDSMVAFTNLHPEAAVYYCCAQSMDSEGNKLPQVFGGPIVPAEKLYETILRADFLIPSTIMMRKSVVKAAGLFDPSFRRLQDGELWIRLLKENIRFSGLSEVLVRYRIHSTSLSNDPTGGQKAMMALTEKHFGTDDGQPKTWPADKRRAYGGAYRYHVLTSIQRQNDWKAAGSFFRMGLLADPTLSTDLDLFYELAHGNQPVAHRGTSYRVDLEHNANNLSKMLGDVFNSSDALELEIIRKRTYGTANYGLGLAAYNFNERMLSRRFFMNALFYRPDLWGDRLIVGNFFKSFFRKSTLEKIIQYRTQHLH